MHLPARPVPLITAFFVAVLVLITAPAARANDRIPVRISMFSWPGYAFWFLARDLDLVPEIALDIQIIEDPYQSFGLMEAGLLDVTSSTAEYPPFAAAEGNNIRLVAYTNPSFGTDRIILAPGVNGAADLVGQSVAVLEGGLSQIFMGIWLEKNGISFTDVQFSNLIMDNSTAAMISGTVAAGAFWEPFGSAVLDSLEGARVVASSETPEWTGLGLLADAIYMRDGFINENPEGARLTLQAYFAAVQWWRENTEEANEIMARAIGFPVEDVVAVIGDDGSPAEGGILVYGFWDAARFMGVAKGDPEMGGLGQKNGQIRDHFLLTADWWNRFGMIDAVPELEAGVSLAPMQALHATRDGGE